VACVTGEPQYRRQIRVGIRKVLDQGTGNIRVDEGQDLLVEPGRGENFPDLGREASRRPIQPSRCRWRWTADCRRVGENCGVLQDAWPDAVTPVRFPLRGRKPP
jgi:hypothetical protein